jgi:uncharacterized membrane protein
MLRKTRLAERGEIDGPSVVKEPHARLFFGVPNALLGSLYFPLLAAGIWIYPAVPVLKWFILLGVVAAAATSLFLAYSLLAVAKRECPYCWASHAINAILLFTVPALVMTAR